MAQESSNRKLRLTLIGVLTSILLFALKLIAGLTAGSLAIISDALNSLLDILAYSAVYVSVRVHERKPDADHHFGHRRAEPLAGLLVALIATILGISLVKDAVFSLFSTPHAPTLAAGPVAVLVTSMVIRGLLAIRYRAEALRSRSAAMFASYVDSRNDVMASGLALIGYTLGSPIDDVAAIAIGAWILYSGGRVGLENLGYLMGAAPSDEVLQRIRETAAATPHVLGLNELKAHYVGDQIHVEVHIELDEALSLREAHDIGVAVRWRLEALDEVQTAFVHIDPVDAKRRILHPEADSASLSQSDSNPSTDER